MPYRIGNLPADAPAWIVRELRAIQETQYAAVDGVRLRTLSAQPQKLFEGLTVLADGVSWEPLGLGTGGGVFTYYGSAWHKLG